jgi:hypothetical protein
MTELRLLKVVCAIQERIHPDNALSFSTYYIAHFAQCQANMIWFPCITVLHRRRLEEMLRPLLLKKTFLMYAILRVGNNMP